MIEMIRPVKPSDTVLLSYSGSFDEGLILKLQSTLSIVLNKSLHSNTENQAILSVFTHLVNNIYQYSEEIPNLGLKPYGSILVLLSQKASVVIEVQNIVSQKNREIIKGHMDTLQALDRQNLAQYHLQKKREKAHSKEPTCLGFCEIYQLTQNVQYRFHNAKAGKSYFNLAVSLPLESSHSKTDSHEGQPLISSLKNLNIQAEEHTPAIFLDTQGKITIQGISYPENPAQFYSPMMEWIKAYMLLNTSYPLEVHFEMVYFNSGTAKQFYDLLDILDQSSNPNIHVYWIYTDDNESIKEAGEDYENCYENISVTMVRK